MEPRLEMYLEAIKLLKDSNIQEEDHVFIPHSSTLVRSFLSEEIQKQKGILPTSLRLVTQGFMSFFRSTPAPPSEPEDKHDPPRTTPKKHRDPSIAQAMNLLRKAGDDYGNDDALWTLANIYFHGHYKAKRDLTQAFDMYAALADRSGNATAQQMVGFMYSTGLGNVVARDEARAILYTTFAAMANNTAAELTMGYKHLHGIGTKKSCEDSVLYYKRVADKTYTKFLNGPPLGRTMPPIKVRLTDKDGGTYGAGASGPGASQSSALTSDINDFIEFHRYLAEAETPQARSAQFQLGILFYTGNAGSTTIPRDYEKAGKYLKKVAESFFTAKVYDQATILEAKKQRPTEAQDAGLAAALLGKMYWRGEGYEVNEATARTWFMKGSILHNPVALNGLGMMYSRGAGGLAVDQAKAEEYDPKMHHEAFKLFEEAAAKGQNFQAIYNLGEMHYYGLGASKSCTHAATYYKYVAERGDWDDPLFTHSYDAYQAGDVEYAAIGYLQAAERGIEVGQSNFAWILDRVALADSALAALGTPSRLLEMALVYWTRSANQGDVDARVKMGDYYFAGIGAEADVTKAHACYKVAADHFSAMAMWNLGWMHENGIGVTKDFHRAKYWYDRSLEMNPKAALPVNLSLFKLNLRYIWNYLTGGETGGGENTGSFWSNHGGKSASPPPNDKLSDEDSSVLDDSESRSQSDQGKNTWDVDEIGKSEIEKWKAQKQVGPDEEGLGGDDRFPQGGDDQGVPDEDDLVEGIVIIGLCMVVGYLMYIRQFRFANNNNQNNQNNQNDNNQRNQNNNPLVDDHPGDPNNPGRFAYYAAGG
ncbi:ERAD-associated protein [Podila minutissima]|uniref:ERAD-associated protein n=1 Tax=Podila minutissima TaxID=64525 RepID=A0A9P5VKK3_9FUNG|nr:ERAD-associated protein [Podila minutissima]